MPVLIYPTAPNRLSARDIPGYELSASNFAHGEEGGDDDAEGDETDAWAWFRKDEASMEYRFLEEGMGRVAEAIRGAAGSSSSPSGTSPGAVDGTSEVKEENENEPAIHGIIGFSQGGSTAAMVASAMEAGCETTTTTTTRTTTHRRRKPSSPRDEKWAAALREANGNRPLRFAVIYSGFYAVPESLAWLYEPKISTPTLHFIGSLDTVVDESRSRGLVERCEDPVVVVHPGGHYVPVGKEWVMMLAGFVRKCVVS